MASKFGGIPVEREVVGQPIGSRFGGVPVKASKERALDWDEQAAEMRRRFETGDFTPEQQEAFKELERRGRFGAPISTMELRKQTPPTTGEPRPGARMVSAATRPLLESIGGMAGAAIGTAGTPGPGTLAGSGLGFAAGSELADQLDEFLGLRERQPLMVELKESAMDIPVGAAFEAGGQSLAAMTGPAIRFVASKLPKIPLTKAGATRKAGEVLAANTTGGPIVAKNIEEAQALEDAIPGLKFSRGQLTDDPSIIKFERARARMPGEAAGQQAEQTAINSRAIRDFIEREKGSVGIGDVRGALGAQREAVEAGAETAAQRLEREAAALPSPDVAEVGRVIRREAAAGKRAAKARVGELFEEVPEFDIDASSIMGKIDELSKPMSRFEDITGNVPEEFAFYKSALEDTGGVVGPDDLQGLRSNLTDSLRDAQGAANPNNRKISRISRLIDEVDRVLGVADVPGEAAGPAAQLKTARQAFRTEVIEKFQSGAVGDILKKTSTGNRIEDAQVASNFFKPGAKGAESAKQFKAAIGDNPVAREAMENYIAQDLATNATNPATGQITQGKLKSWLFKNKAALKEFGLEKRFDSLSRASQELESALETKTLFDKSEASKLLNSDVEKAVQNAFASGSKRDAATRLMNQLKGDKQAVAGLQNSVIDHIITKAETTAADAFGSPVVSIAGLEREIKNFQPAIDVLFRGPHKKLDALNKYRRALRILQRGKVSPLGGGSDTAENVITAMSKASGLSASKTANIIKAVAKPLLEMGDNQVNAILNRAAFDPEFAYTLQAIAKGASPDVIAQRLKGHLASIASRKIEENQ